MATTTSKQSVLNQLLGAIEPVCEPAQGLPVLEQFLFGICRENATPEMAQQAFENLRTQFFDWNEVRVSSPRELEEAMEGLPDAEGRAVRILEFLAEVFETTFSFDMEHVHKKGLKQGALALSRAKGSSDYVSAWVVQRSLEGHALPVDEATVRVCQRLGLIDSEASDLKSARSALEHIVSKSKGQHFTDAVSVLAEQSCWEEEPNCATCPLRGSCPQARELNLEPVARGRAKPR
jgi:endonuclease-3